MKNSTKTSFKRIEEEANIIYKCIMSDITSLRTHMYFISCNLAPCYDVKDVFNRRTKFESCFSVKCGKKTVSEINSGMSGLILDEMDNGEISEELSDKFFSILNKLVFKNSLLKALMLKRSMEEIEKKYQNKYKLSEIDNVFIIFVKDVNGNFAPNIYIDIQVERENGYASKLV